MRRRWLMITLISTPLLASQDPIGWSMTGTVPSTTVLNYSYAINFTIVNNLPFTMPTPIEISNNSTPASDAVLEDQCSGLRLTSGQTCNVGMILTPKTSGQKNLSIYLEYGKNKVQIPNPILTTTTIGTSGALQGVATAGLPSGILSNTTYPIVFTFTNNGTTSLTNLVLTPNSGNTSGFTQQTNTCSGTLASSASCTITGSFTTAATTGNVLIEYTLASGSISAAVITSGVINNNTNKAVRTITFINNCGFKVWFGLVGGAVNNNPCTSDANCASGSFCNPSANSGAGLCFYSNPAPLNGNYELAASGGTNSVLITDYDLQYVWSGNIAGRTGTDCATGTCDTADCGSNGGNNACPVGSGFNQPATLAEITMLRGSIDSYDISILNGTNVGIQMTPTTNYSFNPSGISPVEYNCTSPGKRTQSNGLGNCPWSFTPPANFPTSGSAYKYIYVKPRTPVTGLHCTDDTPCNASGTTCGLYYDRTVSPTTLDSYCGTVIGYNTANQVCSFANTNLNVPNSSNNLGNPYFPCDSSIGGTLPSFTNWAMYACKAQANGDLGTCYNTSANPPESTPNCCGCVNWQTLGGGIVVPSSTTTCVSTNPSWTSGVLPGIEWLKLGCPTAYSYPFDDKSSGFGCMDINGSHTTNTVNYTITFCPQP